ARRAAVRERLTVNGRQVVDLTEQQVREFAGNAVELCGRTPEGQRHYIMAMSSRARRSLRPDQLAVIEQSCTIVDVDIPTIELAGGSVRCMIAGIHLDRRRPVLEFEPTSAVEAIDEDPHTADGRDIVGG
ncbi:MAG TPA: arginine deiminase-related protein, partial [Actinomycetes bacterium]|nr:arginine deiminase-related protein [Actinomycetes bacterium]